MKKLLLSLVIVLVALTVGPVVNPAYATQCMNVEVAFPPMENAPQGPVVVACHGGQDSTTVNITNPSCAGSEAQIEPGGTVTLTNCDCLFAKANGQGCTFVQSQPNVCALDVSNFCAGGNAAGQTRGTVIGSCQAETPVVVTEEVTAPPVNQGPTCNETCQVPCTENGTSGYMTCTGEAGANNICVENSACGVNNCTACIPNIAPPPPPAQNTPIPGQFTPVPGQPTQVPQPQPTVPVGAVCQYQAACVPGMTPNVPAPPGIPIPPEGLPPGILPPPNETIPPEFFSPIPPEFPTEFPPGFLTPTGFPPGFLSPTPGRGTPSVTPRPSATPTPTVKCQCAGLDVGGFFPGQAALVKAYAKPTGANAASGRPKPIVFHFGVGDAANPNNVTELLTSTPQAVQTDPTTPGRYFATWQGFVVPKNVDVTRYYRVWATVSNSCDIIAPLKNVLAAETQAQPIDQGGFLQAIANFFARLFGGNTTNNQNIAREAPVASPTQKVDNNLQINTFQPAKVVKNTGCDGIYLQFPNQNLQ